MSALACRHAFCHFCLLAFFLACVFACFRFFFNPRKPHAPRRLFACLLACLYCFSAIFMLPPPAPPTNQKVILTRGTSWQVFVFAAFLLAWIFLSFLRCLAGASSCHIKPSFKARSSICSGFADHGLGAGALASLGATVFACALVKCYATFHASVFEALECHEKWRNKFGRSRRVEQNIGQLTKRGRSRKHAQNMGKSRYVTQKIGQVSISGASLFAPLFVWTTPFRALHISHKIVVDDRNVSEGRQTCREASTRGLGLASSPSWRRPPPALSRRRTWTSRLQQRQLLPPWLP